MITWNFRLLDVTDENGGEPFLTLVEVHYNDEGVPVGYCDSCTGSEDLEGMKQLIEWYALALDKPVLKQSDFVGVFEELSDSEPPLTPSEYDLTPLVDKHNKL